MLKKKSFSSQWELYWLTLSLHHTFPIRNNPNVNHLTFRSFWTGASTCLLHNSFCNGYIGTQVHKQSFWSFFHTWKWLTLKTLVSFLLMFLIKTQCACPIAITHHIGSPRGKCTDGGRKQSSASLFSTCLSSLNGQFYPCEGLIQPTGTARLFWTSSKQFPEDTFIYHRYLLEEKLKKQLCGSFLSYGFC